MKKISYYDLLGMIKEGNIPDKVYLYMCNKKVAYIKDVDAVSKEFTGYMLDNPDKDQDDNFKYYLGECFLESNMFDECIEVVKDNIFESIRDAFAEAGKQIVNMFVEFNKTITTMTNVEVTIEEDKELIPLNEEWFKEVDMEDTKNIEIALISLTDKLNKVIEVVNEMNKK